MASQHYPSIIASIFNLRKFCPQAMQPIESPSTATHDKSLGESLVFSEIVLTNSRKIGPFMDEELEALDILLQIEPILQQTSKVSVQVQKCLDHIANFLENFQLLGEQLENPSSLLIQSYKYCIEHITNAIDLLRGFPFKSQSNNSNLPEFKEKNSNYSTNQGQNSVNQHIKKIMGEINQTVDTLEETKHTELDQKGANQKQIQNLIKQIQEYEKERQSFIRIHEYYQKQLGNRRKYEEECLPEEQQEPDLPTFNYGRPQSKEYSDFYPYIPYERPDNYEKMRRSQMSPRQRRY